MQYRNSGDDSRSCVKFLGLHIESGLKWDTHIDSICHKLTKTIYLLRKITKIVSNECVLNIYYGLFHSVMQYGIILSGNSPEAIRVFKLQKRAVRIISHSYRLAHCKPIFKKLKIMSLPSLYVFSNLLYVKNNLNTFQTVDEIHSYSTRGNKDIRVPLYKTGKLTNGPNYWALKFYNILSNKIKEMNYHNYKKEIKDLLLDKCLYNYKEFFQ